MKIRRSLLILMILILALSLAGCRKRIAENAANTGEFRQRIQENAKNELERMQHVLGDEKETEKTKKADSRSKETVTAKDDSSKLKKPKKSGKKSDGENEENQEGKKLDGSGDGDEAGEDGTQSTEESPEGQYKELLTRTVGKIYPCQRYNACIESVSERITVNRRFAMHNVADASGCYNIAEMLGSGNLSIEDDWIFEQNPGIIIKFAEPSVLGKGIQDTSAAQSLCSSIAARTGWNKITAVAQRNIVIVSNQLMDTEKGRLVTEFYLAKALYPSSFSDIQPDKIRDELLGSGYEGIYVYRMQ